MTLRRTVAVLQIVWVFTFATLAVAVAAGIVLADYFESVVF